MSWQAIFTAMLPEHILLVGIVVLIGLEIASQTRASFAVSVCVVTAATVAAASLAATGYAMAPFPEQFSVAPDALLAKAVVLGSRFRCCSFPATTSPTRSFISSSSGHSMASASSSPRTAS
jgi:NADH:ubiquinone oxidoreductase subunit 2 (subunit N)